mgnify:CR=1 FL=1
MFRVYKYFPKHAPAPLKFSETQAAALAADLDALARQTRAEVGSADSQYLLRIIQIQRIAAICGRILMVAGLVYSGARPSENCGMPPPVVSIVPSDTVVPPVKVLAPVKVSAPVPSLVTDPAPLIVPA